jgi:hypothetical protein
VPQRQNHHLRITAALLISSIRQHIDSDQKESLRK